MIDFSTQQLSWIVVGALGLGGTGYITMNEKIDKLDIKVSVVNANQENIIKNLDSYQRQLERIEEKIDTRNFKRDK
jgi:peptidoglycan hydrolase CwlO-like protein